MNQKVTISGKEAELVWVDKQGDWQGHHEVDGIPFDGHRVLWSFSYEPKTYLKESELSGEEWRKGGSIKAFRNGVCVMEEFCREPERAAIRIHSLLEECRRISWENVVVGRKVYYKDQPSVIERLLDNGELILKKEGGGDYDLWAYQQEDIANGEMVLPDREWTDTTKVHVTDKNIWWWRRGGEEKESPHNPKGSQLNQN